ncbi:MAG: thioredoxin family protein [Bacteroidales bacterium]|nr:thioredoxin family protein [Bacteroidales bacterium]
MTNILLSAIALLFSVVPQVSWNARVEPVSGEEYQLVISGSIDKDYYIHPMDAPYAGTELELADGIALSGDPEETYTPSEYLGEKVAAGTYELRQRLLLPKSGTVSGTLTYYLCTHGVCSAPEDFEFSVGVAPARAESARSGLWKLILEAVLWGLLMLLTPCVFPMVPMTVSFFLRQKESGRRQALLYGAFIVLLYTLPICVIIGVTWVAGGAAVTADIFNWLATHWLPNIIFFIVFMVFAASFFGLFEITLPASWTTRTDAKSGKGGMGGVFFLALTLVLVSFSCTGPIVGTVLIKSTQGEFWVPIITMLAFSIAFALPFSLLAFFPQVLKKLPRSGGWLGRVKIVLGFVEIALGLKFLSVADQTYHWHILDRDVYLIIWIVDFALLGMYLLGLIRFKDDTPGDRPGWGRWTLAIVDFAFVIYLVTGLFGAPLKALSGYLPPMQNKVAVLPGQSGNLVALPQNLVGYATLEEGLAEARDKGKKVFVDITGHGCVNCREMEARVWSDPKVLKLLREEYVIVSLYVDDKTRLPESEWVTTPSGKVLKDVGRVNSFLVQERFGVNSQPNYFILSPDGTILRGPRGYNLDTDAFAEFLSF